MQPSLAQEFNETAAAAYTAFPKELKKLVVVLGKPVFISPKVAAKLTKDTKAVKEALAEIKGGLYESHSAGLAKPNYYIGETSVNLIALDAENIWGTRRYTKRMKALYTLDHEIGHHIVRNGFPALYDSEHLAESAADAFATLRHIQRFGKNTGLLENMRDRTASAAVLFSDTDHYTIDAIERSIQFAHEMDDYFFRLSLRETAEHAARIADECALNNKTLKKLHNAFQPVADYCEKNIGDAWEISYKLNSEDKKAYAAFCRETLAVMKNHEDDPTVVKAGERFLSRTAIQDFMTAPSAKSKCPSLQTGM